MAWPLGAGARTVSTQAGFAGEGLGYALEAAPAGATIDAGTGLVTIPTGTALEAATVTVRATNAAGSAVQSFAVTVRLVATVFDAAAALAEMSFVAEGAAPAWSLDAGGFARLVDGQRGGDARAVEPVGRRRALPGAGALERGRRRRPAVQPLGAAGAARAATSAGCGSTPSR